MLQEKDQEENISARTNYISQCKSKCLRKAYQLLLIACYFSLLQLPNRILSKLRSIVMYMLAYIITSFNYVASFIYSPLLNQKHNPYMTILNALRDSNILLPKQPICFYLLNCSPIEEIVPMLIYAKKTKWLYALYYKTSIWPLLSVDLSISNFHLIYKRLILNIHYYFSGNWFFN